MSTKQNFWYYPGQEIYPGGPCRNGSHMYREGEFIFYERDDFDGEDNREYEYRGRFAVEDYRHALQELQEKGKTEISGVDPRSETDEPPVRIFLTKQLNGDIALTFCGSSMSCSPGGAHVRGSLSSQHKLDKLLLKK